jgi:hypothetical protein
VIHLNTSEPQMTAEAEGVRSILTELANPRSHGGTPGGYMTSMERAIAKGLVSLEDGCFVLTERGHAAYEAMGSPKPWWAKPPWLPDVD